METKSSDKRDATVSKQRQHMSQGVTLWGDRGPQPIFDAMSTLITVDKMAQACCGFHTNATVSFGPNKKVPNALSPQCSEAIASTILPPGQVSVTPRIPINPSGLRQRLEESIDGTIQITDGNIIDAIHILDMDFTDVDNCISMLTLQKILHNCGNKHPLFVFVSVRKMSAKFSPLQLHTDANGKPIKTKENKIQFKICDNGDPNKYALTDNLGPYIKEQAYETNHHNQEDMDQLHAFAAAVCVRQLQLQQNNWPETKKETETAERTEKKETK